MKPDATDAPASRVLVAGIGNVLRGDDGFGPAVIRTLDSAGGLPRGVRTVDVGIGGIGLVHELMQGYDALVLVDAVDRSGPPGSLYTLELDPPDLATIPAAERRVLAADMHQVVPSRVLIMADALGALPPVLRMVGCQPDETEEFSTELSHAVARAVPRAAEAIRLLVRDLCGEDAGAEIRRRDEILQVMFWMRGERLARAAGPDDLRVFLDAGAAATLSADLAGLAAAGLLESTGEGRYQLTARGESEGGRRFADEFAGLMNPGHGACSDPECDCHLEGPQACLHAGNS